MSKALLLNAAAAGAAGGAATYVDDVFSTFLYTGNSTNARQITNGIDLSGEGGLVWIKMRESDVKHRLHDTERGINSALCSNNTDAKETGELTSFNNNGFSLASAANVNTSATYVSWTFRKQEKFFDIVTYTGNGSNGGGSGRAIAHNLGSQPGMIIVKRIDNTGDWYTANLRADGAQYHFCRLNATNAKFSNDLIANVANSTHVIVDGTSNGGGGSFANLYGGAQAINASGATYVMYLFAHNVQEFGEDSDEAIIKCGSYSGNSSNATTDQRITLGFEPQWVLIKKSSGGIGSWAVFDNMRGVMSDGADRELRWNATTAEQTTDENLRFEADGFTLEGSNLNYTDGSTAHEYIYMAIARPHKPASEFAATDMFKPQVKSAGEGSDTFISTGFPVDAVIYTKRTSNATNVLGTRLTGGTKIGGDLKTDSNDAEGTNSGAFFLDHNNGVTVDFAGGHFNVAPAATDTDYARYYFRRMRGFFDIVTYTSNTTYPNTFAHNLGVVPELVIVKRRDGSAGWTVYAAPSGNNRHLTLNSTAAESSAGSTFWNSTTPTASVVSVGGQDETWGYGGYDYIALLFASASGISKIGSYSGSGSSQNIDCGFSNGSRFVLIKNKNNAGGWYFWDSERGITANNDPFLRLGANDGDQNYTGDDINPHSSGFNVSSNNNAVNKSGRDYLFLAIA